MVGDVAGCDVLLVDDITETAGTLTAAAKIIRDRGRSCQRGSDQYIINEVAVNGSRAG